MVSFNRHGSPRSREKSKARGYHCPRSSGNSREQEEGAAFLEYLPLTASAARCRCIISRDSRHEL